MKIYVDLAGSINIEPYLECLERINWIQSLNKYIMISTFKTYSTFLRSRLNGVSLKQACWFLAGKY